MNNTKISKFIALILRHQPEVIGISLDEHGWADTTALIEGISKTYPLNMSLLEEIVASDEKGRYSFNEDKTKIRANQGHSVKVDVQLKEAVPPDYLFHGTAERFVASINKEGLLPQSRLYVHLSKDYQTALNVGRRHGNPFVYLVDCRRMYDDGYRFFLSENGIWLTEKVPAEYLSAK